MRSEVLLKARSFTNANGAKRIELTLKLTSSRPRPAWDVTINRNTLNGPSVFDGREFTARNGFNQRRSFEVEARTANRLGPDRFVARAEHVASGEVCRVSIRVAGGMDRDD